MCQPLAKCTFRWCPYRHSDGDTLTVASDRRKEPKCPRQPTKMVAVWLQRLGLLCSSPARPLVSQEELYSRPMIPKVRSPEQQWQHLLEMHIPGPLPRPAKSETLGVGASNLHFNKLPEWSC